MPKILKKQEVLLFEGVKLSDFLDKTFLKKLKLKNLDIEPISLVFIAKEEGKKKQIYPIILGHEKQEDVTKKIIHLNMPTTETSKEFIKLLEEME